MNGSIAPSLKKQHWGKTFECTAGLVASSQETVAAALVFMLQARNVR